MIRLAWINSQRPHMSSSLHKKLTGRRSSRDIKRITLNSWVERIPFAHWQKTEPKKTSDHNSSGEQWAMHLSLSSIGGGRSNSSPLLHSFWIGQQSRASSSKSESISGPAVSSPLLTLEDSGSSDPDQTATICWTGSAPAAASWREWRNYMSERIIH